MSDADAKAIAKYLKKTTAASRTFAFFERKGPRRRAGAFISSLQTFASIRGLFQETKPR
jgi:hypothetical protein